MAKFSWICWGTCILCKNGDEAKCLSLRAEDGEFRVCMDCIRDFVRSKLSNSENGEL